MSKLMKIKNLKNYGIPSYILNIWERHYSPYLLPVQEEAVRDYGVLDYKWFPAQLLISHKPPVELRRGTVNYHFKPKEIKKYLKENGFFSLQNQIRSIDSTDSIDWGSGRRRIEFCEDVHPRIKPILYRKIGGGGIW